jgi:glutaredoxin
MQVGIGGFVEPEISKVMASQTGMVAVGTPPALVPQLVKEGQEVSRHRDDHTSECVVQSQTARDLGGPRRALSGSVGMSQTHSVGMHKSPIHRSDTGRHQLQELPVAWKGGAAGRAACTGSSSSPASGQPAGMVFSESGQIVWDLNALQGTGRGGPEMAVSSAGVGSESNRGHTGGTELRGVEVKPGTQGALQAAAPRVWGNLQAPVAAASLLEGMIGELGTDQPHASGGVLPHTSALMHGGASTSETTLLEGTDAARRPAAPGRDLSQDIFSRAPAERAMETLPLRIEKQPSSSSSGTTEQPPTPPQRHIFCPALQRPSVAPVATKDGKLNAANRSWIAELPHPAKGILSLAAVGAVSDASSSRSSSKSHHGALSTNLAAAELMRASDCVDGFWKTKCPEVHISGSCKGCGPQSIASEDASSDSDIVCEGEHMIFGGSSEQVPGEDSSAMFASPTADSREFSTAVTRAPIVSADASRAVDSRDADTSCTSSVAMLADVVQASGPRNAAQCAEAGSTKGSSSGVYPGTEMQSEDEGQRVKEVQRNTDVQKGKEMHSDWVAHSGLAHHHVVSLDNAKALETRGDGSFLPLNARQDPAGGLCSDLALLEGLCQGPERVLHSSRDAPTGLNQIHPESSDPSLGPLDVLAIRGAAGSAGVAANNLNVAGSGAAADVEEFESATSQSSRATSSGEGSNGGDGEDADNASTPWTVGPTRNQNPCRTEREEAAPDAAGPVDGGSPQKEMSESVQTDGMWRQALGSLGAREASSTSAPRALATPIINAEDDDLHRAAKSAKLSSTLIDTLSSPTCTSLSSSQGVLSPHPHSTVSAGPIGPCSPHSAQTTAHSSFPSTLSLPAMDTACDARAPPNPSTVGARTAVWLHNAAFDGESRQTCSPLLPVQVRPAAMAAKLSSGSSVCASEDVAEVPPRSCVLVLRPQPASCERSYEAVILVLPEASKGEGICGDVRDEALHTLAQVNAGPTGASFEPALDVGEVVWSSRAEEAHDVNTTAMGIPLDQVPDVDGETMGVSPEPAIDEDAVATGMPLEPALNPECMQDALHGRVASLPVRGFASWPKVSLFNAVGVSVLGVPKAPQAEALNDEVDAVGLPVTTAAPRLQTEASQVAVVVPNMCAAQRPWPEAAQHNFLVMGVPETAWPESSDVDVVGVPRSGAADAEWVEGVLAGGPVVGVRKSQKDAVTDTPEGISPTIPDHGGASGEVAVPVVNIQQGAPEDSGIGEDQAIALGSLAPAVLETVSSPERSTACAASMSAVLVEESSTAPPANCLVETASPSLSTESRPTLESSEGRYPQRCGYEGAAAQGRWEAAQAGAAEQAASDNVAGAHVGAASGGLAAADVEAAEQAASSDLAAADVCVPKQAASDDVAVADVDAAEQAASNKVAAVVKVGAGEEAPCNDLAAADAWVHEQAASNDLAAADVRTAQAATLAGADELSADQSRGSPGAGHPFSAFSGHQSPCSSAPNLLVAASPAPSIMSPSPLSQLSTDMAVDDLAPQDVACSGTAIKGLAQQEVARSSIQQESVRHGRTAIDFAEQDIAGPSARSPGAVPCHASSSQGPSLPAPQAGPLSCSSELDNGSLYSSTAAGLVAASPAPSVGSSVEKPYRPSDVEAPLPAAQADPTFGSFELDDISVYASTEAGLVVASPAPSVGDAAMRPHRPSDGTPWLPASPSISSSEPDDSSLYSSTDVGLLAASPAQSAGSAVVRSCRPSDGAPPLPADQACPSFCSSELEDGSLYSSTAAGLVAASPAPSVGSAAVRPRRPSDGAPWLPAHQASPSSCSSELDDGSLYSSTAVGLVAASPAPSVGSSEVRPHRPSSRPAVQGVTLCSSEVRPHRPSSFPAVQGGTLCSSSELDGCSGDSSTANPFTAASPAPTLIKTKTLTRPLFDSAAVPLSPSGGIDRSPDAVGTHEHSVAMFDEQPARPSTAHLAATAPPLSSTSRLSCADSVLASPAASGAVLGSPSAVQLVAQCPCESLQHVPADKCLATPSTEPGNSPSKPHTWQAVLVPGSGKDKQGFICSSVGEHLVEASSMTVVVAAPLASSNASHRSQPHLDDTLAGGSNMDHSSDSTFTAENRSEYASTARLLVAASPAPSITSEESHRPGLLVGALCRGGEQESRLMYPCRARSAHASAGDLLVVSSAQCFLSGAPRRRSLSDSVPVARALLTGSAVFGSTSAYGSRSAYSSYADLLVAASPVASTRSRTSLSNALLEGTPAGHGPDSELSGHENASACASTFGMGSACPSTGNLLVAASPPLSPSASTACTSYGNLSVAAIGTASASACPSAEQLSEHSSSTDWWAAASPRSLCSDTPRTQPQRGGALCRVVITEASTTSDITSRFVRVQIVPTASCAACRSEQLGGELSFSGWQPRLQAQGAPSVGASAKERSTNAEAPGPFVPSDTLHSSRVPAHAQLGGGNDKEPQRPRVCRVELRADSTDFEDSVPAVRVLVLPLAGCSQDASQPIEDPLLHNNSPGEENPQLCRTELIDISQGPEGSAQAARMSIVPTSSWVAPLHESATGNGTLPPRGTTLPEPSAKESSTEGLREPLARVEAASQASCCSILGAVGCEGSRTDRGFTGAASSHYAGRVEEPGSPNKQVPQVCDPPFPAWPLFAVVLSARDPHAPIDTVGTRALQLRLTPLQGLPQAPLEDNLKAQLMAIAPLSTSSLMLGPAMRSSLPRSVASSLEGRHTVRSRLAVAAAKVLHAADAVAAAAAAAGLQPPAAAAAAGLPDSIWSAAAIAKLIGIAVCSHQPPPPKPSPLRPLSVAPAAEQRHLTIYYSSISALRSMLPTLRRLEGTLDAFALKYESVDVASDLATRNKMLEVSAGESTLPQLHADGKFLGAADALLEQHDFGELLPMLWQQPAAAHLSRTPDSDEDDSAKGMDQKGKREAEAVAITHLRHMIWGGAPHAHAVMRHVNAWDLARQVCERASEGGSPKKCCDFSGLSTDGWRLAALSPTTAAALGCASGDDKDPSSLHAIVAMVNFLQLMGPSVGNPLPCTDAA